MTVHDLEGLADPVMAAAAVHEAGPRPMLAELLEGLVDDRAGLLAARSFGCYTHADLLSSTRASATGIDDYRDGPAGFRFQPPWFREATSQDGLLRQVGQVSPPVPEARRHRLPAGASALPAPAPDG